MKGTHLQRALRLSAGFARCPRQIFPYVRYLPAWGRQPADVELPWFSFGAIEFLQRQVRREHRVFEFGCGGSSFFFARRAASVLSVENDASWQQRVAALATQRGLANLRCELHSIDPGHPERYPELSYFTALQPLPYDIIVVDGWCDFQNAEQGLLRQVSFERARRRGQAFRNKKTPPKSGRRHCRQGALRKTGGARRFAYVGGVNKKSRPMSGPAFSPGLAISVRI